MAYVSYALPLIVTPKPFGPSGSLPASRCFVRSFHFLTPSLYLSARCWHAESAGVIEIASPSAFLQSHRGHVESERVCERLRLRQVVRRVLAAVGVLHVDLEVCAVHGVEGWARFEARSELAHDRLHGWTLQRGDCFGLVGGDADRRAVGQLAGCGACRLWPDVEIVRRVIGLRVHAAETRGRKRVACRQACMARSSKWSPRSGSSSGVRRELRVPRGVLSRHGLVACNGRCTRRACSASSGITNERLMVFSSQAS